MKAAVDRNDESPLFKAKLGRGRSCRRLVSASIFVGICLILVYRWTHIPVGGKLERLAWIGMLVSEIWFGFYYVLTQSLRWSSLYYSTFEDKLSQRFEKELPPVDIFVCTADPTMEPPILVVNTVLSVMAVDYPQEKLGIFLSDDGGSELTFYALLEAIEFSKHWIPFCSKFGIQQRSPSAYFSTVTVDVDVGMDTKNMEIIAIRKMYEEMENRIETVVIKNKTDPKNLSMQLERKGFAEWRSVSNPNDHHTILHIVNEGRDAKSVDGEGSTSPTVVYLAREKRPNHFHNFKAGALNALIRVSAAITNAPIILTLDCDMTVNNPEIARDALCIFMDKTGDDIGYVQYPQAFRNNTKNNIYGDFLNVAFKIEFPGMNACGGPCYCGTGCFIRRDSISGKKYVRDSSEHCDWRKKGRAGVDWRNTNIGRSISMLEQKSRVYASCPYEQNTQWGKEMGVKYGISVEDVVTGLSIQCKGWRSVFLNPERKGFLGIAPVALTQLLVQRRRWSEGLFHIFLSKYNPFLYGHGKIRVSLQMAYSHYCLWAPCSAIFLFYALLSSFSLLKAVPLFPRTWSLWFIPFAYAICSAYLVDFIEALLCGETLKGWWNMQRGWMMMRVVSYLFGFIDTIFIKLGITNSAFVVTDKSTVDGDVLERFRREVMDFSPASPMFTVLGTVVMVELFCFLGAVAKVVIMSGDAGIAGGYTMIVERLFLQFVMNGMMILVSLPIYEALFFRRDGGSMSFYVTVKSVVLAMFACLLVVFM